MKLFYERLIAAAALACAVTSGTAFAETFDFSYVFNGAALGWPGIVTGELTGTQVGDSTTGYVTGVQVQSLVINGVSVTGILYNDSWDSSGPVHLGDGSAVVSFSKLQNNFIFVNVDPGLSTDISGQNAAYFILYGAGTAPGLYDNASADLPAFIGDTSNYSNDQTRGGVWSLKQVPDSGATVALLGFALAGIAALRRKFGQS